MAALIVVLHHLSLTVPVISDVLMGGSSVPSAWSAGWWLTSTPAQLVLAGPEAVLVFFVLSGMVVALPVLRGARFDWIGYYVQRVLRLYLPAIASIALALLWIATSHQSPARATSSWTAAYSFPSVSLSAVFSGVDLLFGGTGLNNPTWTLRWEVLFSLGLPLFVVGALALRRLGVWGYAVCWLLSTVGIFVGSDTFRFLAVFLAGTLLATSLPAIRHWAEKRRKGVKWNGLALGTLLLSLALMNVHWIVWASFPGHGTILKLATSFTVVGAFGTVLVALVWTPVVWLLTTRLLQWLGRISFSLYLVHVPIIIATSSLFGPGHTLPVIGVSFAISILVGEIFFRFIESPAHRMSRRAGVAASAALSRFHVGEDPEPALTGRRATARPSPPSPSS